MITIHDLPELNEPATMPATPCDVGCHVLCASPECDCTHHHDEETLS